MDTDKATLVFMLAMAAGILVWLWSLIKTLRFGRVAAPQDRFTYDDRDDFFQEAGAVVVPCHREQTSRALARAVRQLGLGTLDPIYKVTEESVDRVSIEKTGPLICNQPSTLYFTDAEFALDRQGQDATKVSYQLGFAKLTRLLRKVSLSIIFGIGLPVLVIVGLVIWNFVLQSDQPAIRWQVLQTFQIVHALWPPFLVLWLGGSGRKKSKAFIENLISSMECQN